MLPILTRRKVASITAAAVASVVLGGAFTTAAVADDRSELEWHLDAMQAEEMWKHSQGSGITVAVLDTGVDTQVPELRGRVLKGKNFLEPKKSPYVDDSGHGTTIAALIAGSGEEKGIQGLAPKSKILPITVTRSAPEKVEKDYIKLKEHIDDAIDYATENGAKIINMSFTQTQRSIFDPVIQKAIDRAHKKGVLLFAGTGNNGDKGNETNYPAAMPGVAAVAATDRNGKVTDFSAYGPYVALAAPGKDLVGRCASRLTICSNDGTSLSTAIASASAALIWSKYPDWTANQVLRVLIETAGKPTEGKKPSKYVGYGAVRPRIALANDNINPGDPNKSPLFSKYYAKQVMQESVSAPPQESGVEESEKNQQDASASETGEGMTTFVVGIGAFLLFIVAGGTVVWARRKGEA